MMPALAGTMLGAMTMLGSAPAMAADSQAQAATVAASATMAATPSPRAYVDVAASAALYSVEAARLAKTRARSAAVRNFAKSQEASGFGIGGQLSWAGRRVDALPGNRLTRTHQVMLDRLRRARDFDATYLAQQRDLIETMRTFHASYARSGGSATLRPVAQFGARRMAAQAAALRLVD
ncbi:DUF4142 domain-containing protein [Sphingomicrobium arenosum]|uniref:DUF4142 domain-containing protein n=1 Tax=Sphingomicrobium arenosum TaxID=2233861 RepID=UPI002240ED4D|nr:DUF4142 domain-containing protein [Sphingomicrobium arenosum]